METYNKDGVPGWRGLFGRITPAPPSSTWSVDFHSVMPEGIEMKLVCLSATARTEAEVDGVLSRLDDATRELAVAGVQFIAVEGAPLSPVRGLDYDREIIKRVEKLSGVPATTAFIAAGDALRALRVKKPVLVSPMMEEFNQAARKFLETNGFEVVRSRSLGLKDARSIRALSRSAAYQIARETFLAAPQADSIVVVSGAWCPPFVIDCLERDLGVPVVHSLQVTAWALLRSLKIKEPVRGWGRLFETV